MSKIKNVIFGITVFSVLLIINACQTDLVYTESITLDSGGWNKSDTLVFSPQLENIAPAYNIYLWVRHNKNYNQSNIWVKILSDPSLTKDETNLVEIPIADKEGVWLGDCSQSLCTQKILLMENYHFTELNAFKVEVLQYMREDNLQNIKNIGLEIGLAKSE